MLKLLTVLASLLAWPSAALPEIPAQNLAAHINLLASDEYEGRAPGTPGETLTTKYLAAQFEKFGLAPGNPDGTYFQEVPLVGYRSVPKIVIRGGGKTLALKFPEDFVHVEANSSTSAATEGADVVFAGYGIVAPMYGWDDYKNLDVRNKLVIVLRGEPSHPKNFKGDTRTWYSTMDFKFGLAAAKGAAGILVVTDPDKSPTYSVFQTLAKLEGCALESSRGKSPIVSGLITVDAARRVLSLAGKDFDSRPAVLTARADIAVQGTIRKFVSRNVVARIEGSDPTLKNEYVLYSAHWDHLGKDPTLIGDQIYNGAIDNAVGTSQLLEIARAFAASPVKPKRSILFVATTAEEKGYLGSRFYTQSPLVPIANTVANINLDGGNAWGATSDLISTGYGLSTIDEVLAEAARLQGRTFVTESLDDNGYYFASDQIEFAKAGIPAVFPFSGMEYIGRAKEFGEAHWDAYGKSDYHQVTDEVRPDWDLSGAAKDAEWLMIAGKLLADSAERPEWKPGSEFARK